MQLLGGSGGPAGAGHGENSHQRFPVQHRRIATLNQIGRAAIARYAKLRAMRAPFAALGACTLLLRRARERLRLAGAGADRADARARRARRSPARRRRSPRCTARRPSCWTAGRTRSTRASRALRGRPVVVNAWASWCDPCEYEMPLFQRAAVRFGRRVAFLGVNPDDARATARGVPARPLGPLPELRGPGRARSRATIGVRTGPADDGLLRRATARSRTCTRASTATRRQLRGRHRALRGGPS